MARPSPRGTPVGRRKGAPWLPALGIAVILGLAGTGAWFAMRQVNADAIDEATLCPVDGATGVLAVLLDLTDPLGATQSLALRAKLDRMIVESPRGTLVALGRVSDMPGDLGAAFAFCRPMTGAEGGEWTRNPTQLDARFRDGFLKPFQLEEAKMLDAHEAKASPIMEGLQALLAGIDAMKLQPGAPRRIVVVSDLLQHSDALSFYRGEDWQSFKASPAFGRLARNLDGADVTIFRVPRPSTKTSAAAVDDFWVRYLDTQGAAAVHVDPLGDL